MGKTLYLECYSGISGDMTVAALLDLGADRSVLDRVLKSLKVSGFETKISRVVKSGIDACDLMLCWIKSMKIMTMIWNICMDIIMKVVSAITPMAQEQRKTITITNTVE